MRSLLPISIIIADITGCVNFAPYKRCDYIQLIPKIKPQAHASNSISIESIIATTQPSQVTQQCPICTESSLFQNFHSFFYCRVCPSICANCYARIISQRDKRPLCPYCRQPCLSVQHSLFGQFIAKFFNEILYYGIVVNLDYIVPNNFDTVHYEICYFIIFHDHDACHMNDTEIQHYLLTRQEEMDIPKDIKALLQSLLLEPAL
jgi:hypothetical protein